VNRWFALVLLFGVTGIPVSAQAFIEVIQGDFPLIVSASHGGYLAPDSLADRTCPQCVTVRDTRTQEWARLLADEVFLDTGRRPWVVINLLARTKLDANREVGEAADGDANAAAAWAEFHDGLETAAQHIETTYGGGLLLDLHGHGHSNARFELGYLLTSSQLRESQAAINNLAGSSSIRALVSRSGGTLTEAIRGGASLGHFLDLVGIRSTPSPSDPAPLVGEPFFSGGYITARHGSRDGGQVDAIQLEAHFQGARNSDDNVALLAERVADAVLAFIQQRYPEMIGVGVEDEISAFRRSSCLSQRFDHVQLARECAGGRVRVYDMLGRLLLDTRLAPGGMVELPPMARGIYLARMDAANEVVTLLR